MVCRTVYCKTVELEASMLRQRSKMTWLTQGDQCSKFFFSKINARRAMQRVYQIQNADGQLVSGSDQAITKIIVNRLQQILHLLIDYSQNAFVPGRSIADNVLLAQELLVGYNQVKLPKRCTIKLDIQKAYDSVQWDFILACLRVFHFPAQFISWIEQCISTAMFSISLNGSVHGFFAGSRGIRQGDPMSPYLFVIVMEIWHVLLKFRTQADNDFQFHWKCQDLRILNLCFADDVLIFCAGTPNSVRIIKSVLTEFAELSGLHVNPGKSTIILSKSVQRERQRILDIIGFQEGSLPIKYLGLPLTSSRLKVADCQPLIDRLSSRLAGWNHLNLSLAGRTQLIKSVLNSLHTYWASVFVLPKSIIKLIEGKMRSFLWTGSNRSGHAKVSWAQVCKPTEEGGLGIRSVLLMNQALILKQVWRILQEDPRRYGWLGCLGTACATRRSGHLMLPRHLGFGRSLSKSVHYLKMAWCIGLAMEVSSNFGMIFGIQGGR
ncbi:UNVERIFIED_CONTAM: hypothetical protein Sradi_7200000 [Sesamum radiatum]|uniref:Reverse transcriptase domain-containing protein n=1 Tax=Sesamum radiatum TaxID=300843 RepID=A0AAW2IPW0_SESRA